MSGLTLLVASTLAAALQTAAAEPPRSEVGVMTTTYDANGRTIAMRTATFGSDFTVVMHIGDTACDLRQSASLPGDPSSGWAIEGRGLTRSGQTLTVRLAWRTANGAAGASDSRELSLQPGDRVPLGRFTVSPSGRCPAVGVALHAVFAPRVEPSGGGFGGGGGARVGGVMSGGGGRAGPGDRSGAGGSTGGGGGTSSGAGAGGGRFGGTVSIVGGRTGSFASGIDNWAGSLQSGFEPATLRAVDVEVWLVQQHPDGTEDSFRQLVRTLPGQGQVIFSPITVPGAMGEDRHVFVRAVLQAQRRTDGGESLFVGIWRGVSSASEGNGPWSALGTSRRPIPMPGPGEVVSLSMPQISATVTSDHVFSLRVRVAR